MKWLSISFMTFGLVLLGVFGFQYFHSEQAQEASMSEALERIEQGHESAPVESRDPEPQEAAFPSFPVISAVTTAASPNEEHGGSPVDLVAAANTSETTQQTGVTVQNEDADDFSVTEGYDTEVSENGQDAPGASGTSSFQANENESFAILDIPKLGRSLPIIEGTDADSLAKGVGRVASTAYPGEGEQIVLSGHRDTVFRDFGQLEIGDRFIVTTPYGEFEYEMRKTEIVDEDDTSVIREMGEEVLVVSTCYPFHLVGTAPERYVIYAYPVS